MVKKDTDDTMMIDKEGLDFLRQKKTGIEEAQIYAGREQGSFFVFITGPESGNVINLNKTRITIGRDDSSDIVINRQFVSKTHAEVVTIDGKTTVTDMGSTNGTYVNDVQIKQVALKDKDEIQVGNIIIKFFQMDLRADKGKTPTIASSIVGSEFYQNVLSECKPFFGQMSTQFLNRQITAHIGKDPKTLSVEDKNELARWIKISAALLLDDKKAETLSNIVSLIK